MAERPTPERPVAKPAGPETDAPALDDIFTDGGFDEETGIMWDGVAGAGEDAGATAG